MYLASLHSLMAARIANTIRATKVASRLQVMAKSSIVTPARNGLVFRNATANEMDIITRRTIQEGWHIGPHDFPCAFTFDPNGFFISEIDGELVTHVSAIAYPKHHSHIGGLVVTEKFRQKGYGLQSVHYLIDACDAKYTIGCDINLDLRSNYEMLGFENLWNTHIAMLDLEKIVTNASKSGAQIPPGIAIEPIHSMQLDKLLNYDGLVFGTMRQKFLTSWINVPGSFGWAAVSEKNIVGYAIVKQVIRGAGTEIGLAMAPLYADNAQIAKVLLKTAAENCLANEAVPKTKLELFHPVGDNCGEDAAKLMDELEAELIHIAYRMYTKGIPPGRQINKIYGIASPTFD